MADFTNLTCPVCNEKFSADDDIVVCPICGTPHHRECYKTLGRCANISWHNEGKIFDATEQVNEQEENAQTDREPKEKVPCRRCGNLNDSDALFCDRCGAPVSQGFSNAGPFVKIDMSQGSFNPFAALDSDELIDGKETWKYKAVVKENPIRFIPQFKAFFKTGKKTSFNLAAFFFSPIYFLYRKMYSLGIVLLILYGILELPSLILNMSNESLSQIVGTTVTFGLDLTNAQISFLSYAYYFSSIAVMAIRFLSGIFANYIYFNKCKKTICDIEKKTGSKDEFLALADKKGGANRVLIIVLVAIYLLVIWSATFFMMNPALM